MSSFVNDNVSESKKQQQQEQQKQQQITKEENILQTTINNTNLNTKETTIISNNDDNKEFKQNYELTNENKSEVKQQQQQCENQKTLNNYDDNKSNNKDHAANIDDDENNVAGLNVDDDHHNVEDKNLNKAKEKSATTLQQSLSGIGATTICCDVITPGDVEQQVTFFDKNQSTSSEQLVPPPPPPTTTTLNNIQIKLESLTTSSLQANDGSVGNTAATSSSSSTTSPSTPTRESSPLPPLPSGLTSNITGTHHLPHICSEPIFGVKLHNNNNNNNNNKNSPKQVRGSSSSSGRDWHTDSPAVNCSSAIKFGTVSASASPNMVRKTSDAAVLLPRRVSFPKSDNELVTGYLEPANPWEHVYMVKSISEIAELYMTSCQKHNTKPLQCILDHLKAVDLTKQLRRQPLLSLKSIKLAPSDCEALEEVLKRVQYKSIDLSDCKLDEAAASALFEMIEYYEATNELDISSNAIGMTHRGWISCTYMISHSQELQVLNAEGNPISKLSADHLGNALITSNLHTLKLEHCGLKGAPLSGLCFKLWQNRVLKELWLAHNDLDCSDADTIAEMLKVNHFLELIDISNNIIRDEGLRHIVMALIMQSKELERRTTFQRTAAIDDDGECMSPVETSPPVELADSNDSLPTDWSTKDDSHEKTHAALKTTLNDDVGDANNVSILCKDTPLPTIEEKLKGVGESGVGECEHLKQQHQLKVTSVKPPLISSVGSTIDETDGDEDAEDTVRSSTIKNSSSGVGQSMLDKLLSMNSESSSEDGASNLSTDTVAACGSEDASLISDDIFDAAAAATNTTTTSTNTKAQTIQELDVTSLNERGATVNCAILNPKSTMSTQTIIATSTAAGAMTSTLLHNSPREIEHLIDNKMTPTVDEMTKLHLIETPASSTITSTTSNDDLNIHCPLVNINNNNLPIMSATQNSSSPAISNNTSEDLQHHRTNHHQQQNLPPTSGIFEVTAEESDCQLSGSVARVMVAGSYSSNAIRTDHHSHHTASRALDVNKNTKLGEDFDDTHSTDSAFESASEGDISRHLPEEFTRLSTSLENTRLDDIAKDLAIETATIASESNECLIAAAAHITPSSTPTPVTPPFVNLPTPFTEKERLTAVTAESSPILSSCLSTSLPSVNTNMTNSTSPPVTPSAVGFAVLEEPTESPITPPHTAAVTLAVNDVREKIPKVTIAQDSFTQKYKSNSALSTSPSLTPTPPPPSTSPGGASSGLRRSESSCAFLTQSSRNRSQSNDSLCSDNSLDGSIGSGDLNFSSSSQLNEKIAKNDTLTRQQRPPLDAPPDIGTRTPGGLKALAVWNNNLSKEAGLYISELLAETVSIELLNIGKNCLSNEFVTTITESLTRNTTLTTLGLQSAHLSAKGIETLSSILTFGGNSTLQRIDIRDNKLEVESLSKIAEVLKSNTTVTQIDLDDEPKRLSVGSEAHLDYARVLENVRSMCSRNEKTQAQILQEKTTASAMAKRRGGYYLGSRKISLTCHSRPVVDTTKNVVVAAVSNSKLDVKRKAGARLRSPVPSPTTISPSSSPNRASRFQVFRVAEVSPLTSPSTQKQLVGGVGLGAIKAVSSSSVAIPKTALSADGGGSLEGNDTIYPSITSTSLPTSCSLPSMATISSSTQSIKRLSVSPRSRFLVRKVYEDPNLPLASRTIQPITPPVNLPPTPISRNSKDSPPPTTNLEATPPPPPATLSTVTTPTTQQSNKKGSEEDLQDLFGSTQLGTPPMTVVTPPTIKQHNNTTTDTTSTATTTPILRVKDISSSTCSALSSTPITANTQKQREQSTNNTTTINDNQNTHPTTATTTISSICSSNLLQSSTSNLSVLSTLSSSPSESSSSSSSSTSPASNNDTTDSSSSTSSSPASSTSSSVHSNEALSHQQQQELTVSSSYGQCPIAVFGDNDITLTKNTVNEVFAAQAAVAAAARTASVVDNIDEESSTSEGENQLILSSDDIATQPTTQQQQYHQHQQQRVRKVSWIANPTAVDKLLTLFHNPTTIFQRSSSPESKTPALSTTTGSQLSQSPPSSLTESTTAAHQQQQQQMSQKSLVSMRKQSPPSWTRLGNDIIQAAGSNNAELANAVATTAAAVVTEQSRSFLDAASKQFRDFSKQVFRQNLSFGNEPAVTTANASTTMITTASALNVPQTTIGERGALLMDMEECPGVGCCGSIGTNGCSCGLLSSMTTTTTTTTNIVECNADCIPTEVKHEIKENISPEHTINEETLHTMQKLYGGGNTLVTTTTAATRDLKNNDDLLDLRGDCFTTTATSSVITSQQSTPQPTTLAASVIAIATTATSGVEHDLPAHNT